MRADAQRNHDLLVDAAAVVFATSGVDAPMKSVADQAGVGVGTVYRRFPRRSDLIVAVFHREVDACADAAPLLAMQYEPFEALTHWIERLLDLIVTKRGLAAALHSGEPAYTSLRDDFEVRLVPALQGLVEGARTEIRADITAAELWNALARLCAPATVDDFEPTRRMVDVLINGLRVESRRLSDTRD
nr:TetR family transcriptional regulator [Bradyrhizobium sp. dw_78]